ncbi:MAG: segregation/condensation protein A [Gammaproteobacteria bacterium]|nr:segregation/condensation protein A [Gammaproteobacteria bacterium]
MNEESTDQDDEEAESPVDALESNDEAPPAEPSASAEASEDSDPTAPEQHEMPFAIVQGTAITELPKDLYIPPDALEVFLEAFEGPLDLLLYLIRRQNLDILDIPIAEITRQYVEYVELMTDLRLELAAEYLVMAAMLAEIKSRMLLPRHEEATDEEGDPRAELVRRLQEYERFKQAAEDIDELPRVGRDLFPTMMVDIPELDIPKVLPEVSVRELTLALADVLARAEMFANHTVQLEPLSVRECMAGLLERVSGDEFVEVTTLFIPEQGKLGIIVTFLAILELIRESLMEMIQARPYGPIHIKAISEEVS